MATTWFSVGGGKSGPNFSGGGGTGKQRLDGERDGTKDNTVYQFILAYMHDVLWIWSCNIVNCDGWIWNWLQTTEVTCQSIPIKESMHLTTPHEVIGGSELCNVLSIDVEESTLRSRDHLCGGGDSWIQR